MPKHQLALLNAKIKLQEIETLARLFKIKSGSIPTGLQKKIQECELEVTTIIGELVYNKFSH